VEPRFPTCGGPRLFCDVEVDPLAEVRDRSRDGHSRLCAIRCAILFSIEQIEVFVLRRVKRDK